MATTDAFSTTRKQAESEGVDQANIRRPLRGIQVKKPTYAVMRVKTASGEDIDLVDSSSDRGDEAGIGRSANYANFLIQAIQETRSEKQQIIETFGEDYVYFFGERPRVLDVNGMLINTADFNWKSEFWKNYDEHLRGTKLVEQNARLYLYFDDVVIEGYMLGAAASVDAGQPHMLPFRFNLFVTNYHMLSKPGSMTFGASDTGIKSSTQFPGVAPHTTQEALSRGAVTGGGLNAFVASVAHSAPVVALQQGIEQLKNALYGRQLVVPKGIGTMETGLKRFPPLNTGGSFPPAPTGQPIHTMADEYVARSPQSPSAAVQQAWQKEQDRILDYMAQRDPEFLEAAARADFEAAGIDTSDPSVVSMILGRGAFAALQYAAPFGLAKAKHLGQADQAMSTVLRGL